MVENASHRLMTKSMMKLTWLILIVMSAAEQQMVLILTFMNENGALEGKTFRDLRIYREPKQKVAINFT